jgi:iron complex transport system substrate-binding protein
MRFSLISLLFLVIFLAESCNGRKEKLLIKNCSDSSELIIKAERLTIQKSESFTKVTIINPWQGANNVSQAYFLLQRGKAIPVGLDSSQVVFVPLRNIICMSTTHIAMISALGEGSTISGVSGTGYIYSDSLITNVEKGLIADVGYEVNLNNELILKISPDLVMMYGIGSESVSYVNKIEELGVKVLFNADYLETDPLGKAEWIKLFGALYCKESLADSIFNSETESYNKLKSYIKKNASYMPKVLLGLPYKDTWYISPGNSFVSKLIADAGGDYIWSNTISSESMPYGIENVYIGALVADYWLNMGSVKTKTEISIVDNRLSELPCFKKGNLYNNINRVTISGGNDYWETGTVHPGLILKDLAAIFHPELFNEHKLFFYRKLD